LDCRFADRERYTLESKDALPAGKATVKYELNDNGGGAGKGGAGQLFVNDQKVADGRIERTRPLFSQRVKPKTSARTRHAGERRR
jgi:hypothetical protein